MPGCSACDGVLGSRTEAQRSFYSSYKPSSALVWRDGEHV